MHAAVAALALADLGYLLFLGISKTGRPKLAVFSFVPFAVFLADLGLRIMGRIESGVGGVTAREA